MSNKAIVPPDFQKELPWLNFIKENHFEVVDDYNVICTIIMAQLISAMINNH